ncbi:MAG TPA: MFS transporter [Nocardioides sp.]|nr:MFS transporter [Nocardioides sp.]
MTPVPAVDRRARLAVFAGFAVQGLTFASLVTRLPAIKDRFDLSDVDILLLVLAVAGLSAIGSMVAGQAAARWGSAVTLRAALAGSSVAVLLVGPAGSFGTVVAASAAYGFFVGGVDASLNMQGVAVQDRYGRSIMTGFHAMWSLAAACGAGYAAVAAGLDWSLTASLAVVCATGLAINATLCRGLLPIDLDPLEEATVDAGTAGPPAWPVLLIAVPTFVMWLGDGATSTWSGIYLEDGLSASAATAPVAYGAYQLLVFLTRLVGDRLVQRWGPAPLLRAAGWVAVCGLALVVAAPGLPVVVAGFALLGGGLSLVPPLSMVAAAHVGEGGDQAVARVNVANYLGFIVAAVGIAAVSELASPRAMFVVPLLLAPVLPLMARQFTPRHAPSSRALTA